MAPMKRTSTKRSKVDPIKSRCKIIKEAVEEAEVCSDRVKKMLCSTLDVTLGAYQANRHAFNERVVAIIGEVLENEHKRLVDDLAAKEAAFTELSPAKSTREAALEQAKADVVAKAEALEAAKKEVTEITAKIKEAGGALKEAEKAQKSGDASLNALEDKKAKLEACIKDSFAPLEQGTAENKAAAAKAVLEAGKDYSFDASLLQTAEPVLHKELADRGTFDALCLENLKAAFDAATAGLDGELAAGATGKAERAAAVAAAEAAKKEAEDTQATLKETAQAAKDAKSAADAAQKAAAQSLEDFMPELKKLGDALDEAKEDLKDFKEEPMTAYDELKALKEGDFYKEIQSGSSYYETIDGMKLARSVIDACRTTVQDGQISLEDAKRVFEEVADAKKETRTERWTVRYCLQEFKWDEAARGWLIEELKKVPQEKLSGSPAKKARTSSSGYYETIDGFKCDKAIVDVCRDSVAEAGISEEDAQKVWTKAEDGNKVTNCERWTLRYCLEEFKWSPAAYESILSKLREAAA